MLSVLVAYKCYFLKILLIKKIGAADNWVWFPKSVLPGILFLGSTFCYLPFVFYREEAIIVGMKDRQ